MPRTSIEALLIRENVVEAGRPDAPYDLGDAEADQWRMIVGSMPPNHFAPQHYSMLAQLCRHNVAGRMIGTLIAALRKEKKIDTKHLTHLLALQDKETKAIIALMRSMRLTQQSIYRANSSKIRPGTGTDAGGTMLNPWEDDD